MIKYDEKTLVTFTEVPDEIALCLNITGCPCHCEQCFEPWLRDDYGIPLDTEEIDRLLAENPHISCLCFMGGDRDHKAIAHFAEYIHIAHPTLKVAMYSGRPEFDPQLGKVLDYYKYGPYMPQFGPLNLKTTNQKFLKKVNNEWQDITSKFQIKKV